MGSCPMPKYKGGPVPNPYCMRNAGIKRVSVYQKFQIVYPYCAVSSANEGTDTAFANDSNLEASPYPITDDGIMSLVPLEPMYGEIIFKRNAKQRKNMEE